MEDFIRLFGGLLALVYHCFDRIVILGHLPLLTRPENIVHFFRDVHSNAPPPERGRPKENFKCRRSHNRLGFAHQVAFVRLFDRFPKQQPFEVTDELVRLCAAQIGS